MFSRRINDRPLQMTCTTRRSPTQSPHPQMPQRCPFGAADKRARSASSLEGRLLRRRPVGPSKFRIGRGWGLVARPGQCGKLARPTT
jgi:hypothetical protein